MMNKRIESAFDKLESQRIQLLNEVRNLDSSLLTSAPEGKWSILAIISHIMTTERLGLEYINKKILGVEQAGESGLWEEFKLALFKLSQRSPNLKYKAPRLIAEKTTIYDDIRVIETEWTKLREQWQAFLTRIPERHVNKKVFRHAVGGRFNVVQGLQIFYEHVNHHLPQIWTRMGHNNTP